MFIKAVVTSAVIHLTTGLASRKDEVRGLISANALTAPRTELLSCTTVGLFVRTN